MPKTTGLRDREEYLVARLAKKIPSVGNFGNRAVPLGIGDDSAVLRPSAKSELVASCDFSLEGVHFRDATHPAVSIGYRCLARATSDIVAMGARPRYFLLALALPTEKTLPAPSTDLPAAKGANWLDSFASGMGRAARELGMLLIGGDITVSPSVTICITVIGELPAGHAIPRSGARPGDLIYVTGTLGAAQLGLQLLLRGVSPYANRPPKGEAFDPACPDEAREQQRSAAPKDVSLFEDLAPEERRAPGRGKHTRPLVLEKLLQPHLYPRIPIAFAQTLARRRIPSAMMDISDGLSTDLARLCQSSSVGARLFAAQIPRVDVPPAISRALSDCHSEPMQPAPPERRGTSEAMRRSSSGHGFSRAVTSPGTVRLQPLRDVLESSHSSAPNSNARYSSEPAVLDPLQLALHGGEDYAILFTVPPNRAPLLRSIAAKTKTRITQIGEIIRSRKILLVDENAHESPLEPRGWNPFFRDNHVVESGVF